MLQNIRDIRWLTLNAGATVTTAIKATHLCYYTSGFQKASTGIHLYETKCISALVGCFDCNDDGSASIQGKSPDISYNALYHILFY